MYFSNVSSGPLRIWFHAWVFRSADRMVLVEVLVLVDNVHRVYIRLATVKDLF